MFVILYYHRLLFLTANAVYTHQLQRIFQVAVFQWCLEGQQNSKPTGASVGSVRLLLEQSESSLGMR